MFDKFKMLDKFKSGLAIPLILLSVTTVANVFAVEQTDSPIPTVKVNVCKVVVTHTYKYRSSGKGGPAEKETESFIVVDKDRERLRRIISEKTAALVDKRSREISKYDPGLSHSHSQKTLCGLNLTLSEMDL